MSTNLNAPQMAASQDSAEITSNGATGRLDAAITEVATTLVGASNAATITDENLRAANYHVIDEDSPPATAAITITLGSVKRGLVIFENATAFAVTVEIAAQPLASPSIAAGDVALLDSDGTDVRGLVGTTGPVKLPSHTVAGVPSASGAGAGSMIYVSDETGGAIPAFSDGTNWRRVTDRAIVA